MASISGLFLLALCSCVQSSRIDSEVYGSYLFEYWNGGDDTIPWCNAEQACLFNNPAGSLATPKTHTLNDVIFDLVRNWPSSGVWLGGNDIHLESWWVWVDGTKITNDDWSQSQPDNVGGEDCLEMDSYGQWNDGGCEDRQGYVCQTDLSKTAKSDFVELVFSDSFFEGSKNSTSINEARRECKSRGLKLVQEVSNAKRRHIVMRLSQFTDAKYCIDDENHGKMMGSDGILGQECSGQSFLYICEGYRPHYIRISGEALVVEDSEEVEIECTADGYPVPQLTWHKNHEYVITTDTNSSIHQKKFPGGSTLVIKNAKQDDEDRYRCFASNSINGEKHSLRIFTDLKVKKNTK